MNKVLLAIIFVLGLSASVYSQDSQELIGQVAKIYTGSSGSSAGGLIGGFTMWGLIGGFLFGSIGFIAFVYGQKNSELRPMLIGIALMVYPYFLRGTWVMYLLGTALSALLYFSKG